jgi:trans-aconitate methyltransferase
MDESYVHGYSTRESERLFDQANTLAELLHHDTSYPAGNAVLEVGCGVGAQTLLLARNSPLADITSIDASEESVEAARELMRKVNITNVSFQVADIFDMPFEDESFDHVFICFVLEHLENPLEALQCLKRVLKPNGSMTVIEGDHGSAYFYPPSQAADRAIQCLIDIQSQMGGNAIIGRQLYPLLLEACLRDVQVSPRMVYADASRPEMVDGFTRKTFTAMVEGAREQALSLGLISPDEWEQGIRDLYRTAQDDGVFCYTFFKGLGWK